MTFNSRKYLTEGVKLTRGINVKEGRLDWKDTAYWSEVTSELKKYVLCDGDILIGMDGSKVGKNFCQINVDDLPLLLLQRVARLRAKGNLVPRFLFWNIASVRFLDWVNTAKTDPMIPHIAPSDINGYVVSYPPITEQTAIAHFLDQKTAQIDAAIAIKEQQIALLKERKQILIQQAVTQGLDPTVPMKNSGVEWIGEIPAHWECLKLKLACKFIYDGTHGSYPRVEEGYRLLSVRNIINDAFFFREDDSRVSFKHFKEISSKFLIQEDDIQLAIVGATLGKVAIIKKIEEEFVTQRSLSTIRVNSRCNNEFLAYFMRSPAFQAYLWNNAGFSAQPGVYLNTVQNCYMPLPSIDEQKEIM